TITSVSPAAGFLSGGNAVTISGTSMSGVSVVIGGNPPGAILGRTATSVTINTPGHAAGLVDITVTNSLGSAPCTACFNYVPAPTITGLSPSSGTTDGGPAVTITGTNLALGSITVGGISASVTSASDTSLTFTTPPHAPGNVNVTVTTPGG